MYRSQASAFDKSWELHQRHICRRATLDFKAKADSAWATDLSANPDRCESLTFVWIVINSSSNFSWGHFSTCGKHSSDSGTLYWRFRFVDSSCSLACFHQRCKEIYHFAEACRCFSTQRMSLTSSLSSLTLSHLAWALLKVSWQSLAESETSRTWPPPRW